MKLFELKHFIKISFWFHKQFIVFFIDNIVDNYIAAFS